MKVQLCRYKKSYNIVGEKIFFFFKFDEKRTPGYRNIEQLINNSFLNDRILPESFEILKEFEIEDSEYSRNAQIRKHLEEFLI